MVGIHRVRQGCGSSPIESAGSIELCDRSDAVCLVAVTASRWESASHDAAFASVSIQAPVIGEEPETPANRGIGLRRPGKSHAGHKIVEDIGLNGCAPICVGCAVPIGAHGVRGRVEHLRVEGSLIALDLIPPMVDLVAET